MNKKNKNLSEEDQGFRMVGNFFCKLKKPEYFLLLVILVVSTFLRLYKIQDLLGFWYDQGRDALVIWDLLHYGKFFLIGPVTGIEGIFLGPFYYYLITPFYWLGKGDPAIASVGIALMDSIAVFLIYNLGKKIFSVRAGLIAALLYGFSYRCVLFSRWLANPAPLPLFTLIVLLFLLSFINGNKKSLIFVCFFIGLCLQLEAASAVFFLPSTIIIIFLYRKNLTAKVLILSFFAFSITLLPQIYFNFRHDGVLLNAFKKFLIEDKSFKMNLLNLAKSRLLIYYDAFTMKLFPSGKYYHFLSLASFSAMLIFFRKKIFNKGGIMIAVWFIIPLLGYLFYQGNHGYLWDYYLTGVIPVFMVLFAGGINFLFEKNLLLKILICVFLILFVYENIQSLKGFYGSGMGISLRAEKKAIDWIYQDTGSSDFNIDVYVPPLIYYSYSYLFKWYGNSKYGREPNTKLVKNLYTIYEPDGERPFLLDKWLKRQDTIGKIVKDNYFWGDITVQKRERILNEYE